MSDTAALVQEKQKLIDQMLDMQRQFIEYEHANGIGGKDYWASESGLLKDYRHKYNEMAMRVVDLAHEIVGSKRVD
jgi:hypothetical protein